MQFVRCAWREETDDGAVEVGEVPWDRRPRGRHRRRGVRDLWGALCGKEGDEMRLGIFFCAHDGIASWVGESKMWGPQISYSNACIMGKILSASNANIMGWREYLIGFTRETWLGLVIAQSTSFLSKYFTWNFLICFRICVYSNRLKIVIRQSHV